MAASPSVALCMIVRDEAHNLTRCLGSASGLVNETWVVDTGSSDGTEDVARSLGAQVVVHPWHDDFAAARNAGIDRASSEWILVLDADECLEAGAAEGLRSFLESDGAGQVGGCVLPVVSYLDARFLDSVETSYNVRLFRNRPGHRYRGAVHEQILDSLLKSSPGDRIAHLPLRILHYGYVPGPRTAGSKAARNLAIIQQALDGGPEDIHLRYHAGICLYNLGRYSEAAGHLRAVVEAPGLEISFMARALKVLVMALRALGEKRAALAILDRHQGRWPRYTDLEYLRGVLNRDLGQLERALYSALRCLEMGPPGPPFDSHGGSSGYQAAILLGEVAVALGKLGLAERAYLMVSPRAPAYVRSRTRLLELWELRLGREGALKNLLGELPAVGRLERGAEVCAAAGWGRQAAGLAARAPGLDPGHLSLLRGQALLAAGDAAEALDHLAEIPPGNPHYRAAVTLRVCCVLVLESPEALAGIAREVEAGAGVGGLDRPPEGDPGPAWPELAAARLLLDGGDLHALDLTAALPGLLAGLAAFPRHRVVERIAAAVAGRSSPEVRARAAGILLYHMDRPDLARQVVAPDPATRPELRVWCEATARLHGGRAAVEGCGRLTAMADALPADYLLSARTYLQLAREAAGEGSA